MGSEFINIQQVLQNPTSTWVSGQSMTKRVTKRQSMRYVHYILLSTLVVKMTLIQ